MWINMKETKQCFVDSFNVMVDLVFVLQKYIEENVPPTPPIAHCKLSSQSLTSWFTRACSFSNTARSLPLSVTHVAQHSPQHPVLHNRMIPLRWLVASDWYCSISTSIEITFSRRAVICLFISETAASASSLSACSCSRSTRNVSQELLEIKQLVLPTLHELDLLDLARRYFTLCLSYFLLNPLHSLSMFRLPLVYFLDSTVCVFRDGFHELACGLLEFLEAEVNHGLLRIKNRAQVDRTECRRVQSHEISFEFGHP